MTTAERRRRRLGILSSVLAGAVLVAGCITGPSLPSRSGAGVLTTQGGSRYMVLTPCSSLEVDEIALKYVPPGATPEDSTDDEVVIAYRATTPLPPARILAPLDPREPPPAGLELIEWNEELLTEALESQKTRSLDNSFYVEANGHRDDETSVRIGGSWAADMAGPDTVVLRSEVFDDPASRHCGSDDIGWVFPDRLTAG